MEEQHQIQYQKQKAEGDKFMDDLKDLWLDVLFGWLSIIFDRIITKVVLVEISIIIYYFLVMAGIKMICFLLVVAFTASSEIYKHNLD